MVSPTQLARSKSRNYHQRRRIAVLAVCIAAAAAVCATVLEDQEARTVKAVWSAEETIAFIDYLYKHQSQTANGGNFKTATFAAAAEAISPLLKHGAEKTEKVCRRKWSSIKYIYSSIQKYQAISGVHWDNTDGADINGGAEERVWNSYIAQKSNRAMKAFRNTGWLHYDKVQAIHNSVAQSLPLE